jgi:hypothetical protein
MKKRTKFIIGAVAVFGIIGALNDDDTVATIEETPVEEVVEEAVKEEAVKEEAVKEEAVEVEPVSAEPVEPVIEEEPVDTELLAYSTSMGDSFGEFESIMYDFSDLMLDAGNDPYLMFDDAWTIDVATQLVLMQGVIDDIKSLNAPTGFEDVHNKTLQAMDEYQYVVDNLPRAIDNMDVDLINSCSDAVANGTRYIGEASSLLSTKM